MKKSNTWYKILFKVLAIILAVIFLILGSYVLYICLQYYRIKDNESISINNNQLLNVKVGDDVIIFGTDGNNTISVDTVALLLGTINYEVVCGISRRVPRVYYKNGKIHDIKNFLI